MKTEHIFIVLIKNIDKPDKKVQSPLETILKSIFALIFLPKKVKTANLKGASFLKLASKFLQGL